MNATPVLITRPQGQNQGLCEGVQRLGCEPRVMPLLTIEPMVTLADSVQRALAQLDQYQHVIFVSANAVRWGMARILEVWPQLPADLRWYCVGQASAQLLEGYGVSVAYPTGAMTSEALLALPGLAGSAGQRVLIVKGEGGREYLQQQLQQLGAGVEQLPVYRRTLPEYSAEQLTQLLAAPAPAAMLVNSGESLHNMVSLLSRIGATSEFACPLVVPGQRVAVLACELGFTDVQVAENATDGAMLEALAQRLAGEGISGRI